MDCDIAMLSLRQSAAEKEANLAPTLTGSAGVTFNEPPVSCEVSGNKSGFSCLHRCLPLPTVVR
jgi:hypothetical protein